MLTNIIAGSSSARRGRLTLPDRDFHIQVAAMPWRRIDDRIEILLITSRDSGRWVLPKGWPEKKENLWDAAAREAGEEAGIKGHVAKVELGRYIYSKGASLGSAIPCEVFVYPLKVKALAEKWKESRQRSRRWMSVKDAAAAVREGELAQLILDFGTGTPRNAT